MAIRYLEESFYKIIEKNYRIRWWEIDIIWIKDGITIFFEVRLKIWDKFGLAEESITPKKISRIKKAWMHYCFLNKIDIDKIRFDFIAINKKDWWFNIKHFKNIDVL